ncbi:MAG: hypothetical protein EBU90_06655 [Proteobacteria bacterium]|nr:hypothetical protein [Pseudomonadota bacterium]NBP14988.1 hypothetical protein [bacterium]
MARTIQSPGVQISEIDLSLRAVGTAATTVLVPGFAAKGPVGDTIRVSSLSEFEQIYGTPTNAAERYFYHSVKAVFQSPADVLVYRMPYGEGTGINSSEDYSALVYPVATYVPGTSAADSTSYAPVFNGTSDNTALSASNAVYLFGAPTHIRLTQQEYLDILRGVAFNWSPSVLAGSNSFTRGFNTVSELGKAGLIILNKGQSSINSRYEGFYVGVIDNTNLNPATEFTDVNRVLSINTDSNSISGASFLTLPEVRLNFALSATQAGTGGSISEVMENIHTFDEISTNQYDDTVTLALFKLRQSVFSPDTISLDYVLSESYVASLDYYRQQQDVNGGPPKSFYLETLDDSSAEITTLVNPYISNRLTNTWLDANGIPTKKVRFLSSQLASPLTNEGATDYTTRVGAPSAAVAYFNSTLGTTDSLVALGDYTSQDIETKLIGNVPSKLSSLFDKIENYDVYPLNLTVEAGLGTIYVNSKNPATSGYFDDTVGYAAVQALTAQNSQNVSVVAADYNAVAGEFVSFAEDKRKDHLFIADPITNIFVEGKDVRTLDNPSRNFSSDIYWPLRNQFNGINTSYACTYGNVAKVVDVATNQQVWVPFSGFAAALMANTDSNYQPWFAPAGFTRGIVNNITDLAIYPKQKQRDQLYKIGVNPVAFFPAEGFVVYGQKTLQKKPSAFDRINVRRLFLNLETATRDTVKYFIFEPNTLFTRTQILNTLTPIFDNAKNTQGVYDYLLICDERNNTGDVIDDNTLVVDIYLKPTRTAEFILANFYATRTGISFQEIVS